MKVQIVGMIVIAGLASCQKSSSGNKGTPNVTPQKKDEGTKAGSMEDDNEIAIVNLTDDLGTCSTSRRGRSYYVLAEKKFRYCADTDQWDVIDLKGADGSAGKNSLVAVTPEAAGINCASGGQKIRNGLDQNANGQLDSSEVTSTSFACHGLVGVASLVSVTAESAGANCTAGGRKIQIGLDDNKDGTLQVSEAQSTQYVCNGSNGFSGFSSLSTANTEPPGSNCSYGGIRVNIGLDNGDGGGIARDGVLSAGEVDNTSYVCQATSRQRTIRVTDATINTAATDDEKDNFCKGEFGQSYVAATFLDAVYNWPAVVYGWSVYGFGIAGKTVSVLPQELSLYEVIYFSWSSAGTYKLACIEKSAPLRFTRATLASNVSNTEKTALCQTELGAIYSAASVQDVTLHFHGAAAANPPAWTARDTTYTYRIDPQGKSHFALARIGTPGNGVVACRND